MLMYCKVRHKTRRIGGFLQYHVVSLYVYCKDTRGSLYSLHDACPCHHVEMRSYRDPPRAGRKCTGTCHVIQRGSAQGSDPCHELVIHMTKLSGCELSADDNIFSSPSKLQKCATNVGLLSTEVLVPT